MFLIQNVIKSLVIGPKILVGTVTLTGNKHFLDLNGDLIIYLIRIQVEVIRNQVMALHLSLF